MALINYTNLRDQKSSETKEALAKAIDLACEKLRIIVHRYPDEIYLKAEYIEFTHNKYGPQQA